MPLHICPRHWESAYTRLHGNGGQFTGLLDKNGKEIYEGDVLLFGSNKTPNKCDVGWNNRFTSFCVRLSYEERFGIKPLGEWLFVEPMEVIGNIHDHPELLNSKQ